MTLNQLLYFQTVAECENYHKAAEKLYISQPSLSRSIAALEAELGVILFEKQGRGIKMTREGNLFLEYAGRIVRDCTMAKRKMHDIVSGGGQISIGYVYPLAEHFIPHTVRMFLSMEENADVNFHFYQSHTPNIVEKIKAGELDVGFGGYMANDDDLEFCPILQQELVIITPKEHPLNDKDWVSIKEVNNYPVIGYEKEAWMGRYLRKLSRQLALRPSETIDCPDEHSIQAMVSEGFGIALVPWVDELDKNKVVIHRLCDIKLYHRTFMIWMKNRYQMPASERFIAYVRGRSEDIFGKDELDHEFAASND